jgi:hypothetical protein
MEPIRYFHLTRRAWSLIRRRPILILLGFLIVLEITFGLVYLLQNQPLPGNALPTPVRSVAALLQQGIFGTLPVKIGVFIGLILFLVTGMFGRSALIFATDRFEKTVPFSIKRTFRAGKKHTVPFLALEVLTWSFLGGLAFLFFLPAILLLSFDFPERAGILFGFGLILFLPLAALSLLLRQYSRLYLVLSRISLISAVGNSYQLFQKRFKESLVAGCFFVGLHLIFLLFLILVFFAADLLFPAFFSQGQGGYATGFAAVAWFLLWSWYETFHSVLWTLFFKDLAKPRDTREALQKDVDIVKENMAVGLDQA